MSLEVSLGFDAGNYANAYETQDYDKAIASLSPNRSPAYVAAFTLGFFSTYELSEMGAHWEAYRQAYFSETGRACRAAGYVDIRPGEEWLAIAGDAGA